MQEKPVQADAACFHCGQPCDAQFTIAEKRFCCYGCQVVYEIINDNNLCEYYQYDVHPGKATSTRDEETFAGLDDARVRQQLVEFQSDSYCRVRFRVPAIHCVSCIWLLENLRKLDAGILRSEVNFSKKSVVIDFNPQRVTLGRVATLMASVGYAPEIRLSKEKDEVRDHGLATRLAIAGFCFGNVMLFSFPEYLGMDANDEVLRKVFSILNVCLALLTLLFSAGDYFTSTWNSFKQRQINIDVPIAVGLLALFLRSTWDIVTGFGPGYLDSFTGLVFFLLIGRWFQGKTYESLAFDRDFKSYFPLTIQKQFDGAWKPCIIHDLELGDTIQVRNGEIVPADSALESSSALMDYSFVTGESRPVTVGRGDRVYAGGRLIGQPVILVVEKKMSQSHLTSLWNHESFRKREESKYQRLLDRAGRMFTWVVLWIAIATAVYWYYFKPDEMWLVVTAVLMVACPCALALAAPFTYGSMLRVFGSNQLYLKNADVIERMAGVDKVVFDKTGTVTIGTDTKVVLQGSLTDLEQRVIKTLTSFSTHPMSKAVHKFLPVSEAVLLRDFREWPGKGIEGVFDGQRYRVGSAAFVGSLGETTQTRVWVSIDGEVRGNFQVQAAVRSDIPSLITRLGSKCAGLLSGDGDGDREEMRRVFGESAEIRFNQDPHEKRAFIEKLQTNRSKVLMVGDGLNDAGALKQSDVGISITDDSGVFTPASDGILWGARIGDLDKFLRLAKRSSFILRMGFGISFFYNAVALSFAVTGNLTPLTAAILMPVSSISVVSFATLAVKIAARREGLDG